MTPTWEPTMPDPKPRPEFTIAPAPTLVTFDDAQGLAPPPAPSPTARPLPRVEGYDVLAEVGRGGMGVVYKALHLRLKRVVALKMLRPAPGISADDWKELLDRFRREAEALARVKHPNIVEVYDIGETPAGVPYFSLEFCRGGSLAGTMDGTPLQPTEAATLTRSLAQGMQTAHQAHVIHRDLKPGNVLLAEDGTPKVTDFGLAKKLDEVGHTHTG